jgi:hypothetical protein
MCAVAAFACAFFATFVVVGAGFAAVVFAVYGVGMIAFFDGAFAVWAIAFSIGHGGRLLGWWLSGAFR